MGGGSIEVVNLYPYRATSPRDLRVAGRPVGVDNDVYIRSAVLRADAIVCAWGAHEPKDSPRPEALRRLLSDVGRSADCLGRAQNGQPRHPLMLSYNTPRVLYHLGGRG